MQADVHLSSRFYVLIDGMPQAVFSEISGMEQSIDVLQFAEGGSNETVHWLPGRARAGTLTLRRGLIRSSELLGWYLQIARGDIVRRNVSVVLYDTGGIELLRWNLLGAYPIRWVGPHSSALEPRVAVETIELAYEYIRLE
jgi:phage tail-like protein